MQLTPHHGLKVGDSVERKLRNIIFPLIQFSQATIDEAIEFLRIKGRELDSTELDPTKKGVEILVEADSSTQRSLLTLDLRDVPMFEAIRYVAELSGMKAKMGPDAVLIVPAWDKGSLPHVTVHVQATGQLPIDIADFDVAAFIDNIRNKHTEEIVSKLAPHLHRL